MTRTMQRGLRPPSAPSLDKGFSQKAIERMAERIETILTNNRILDKEAYWIVAQALLAVSFRMAESNEEKNRITQEIKKHGKKGHRLGFSETEIGAVNRVVLQEAQAGQLENLAERFQQFLKKRIE